MIRYEKESEMNIQFSSFKVRTIPCKGCFFHL